MSSSFIKLRYFVLGFLALTVTSIVKDTIQLTSLLGQTKPRHDSDDVSISLLVIASHQRSSSSFLSSTILADARNKSKVSPLANCGVSLNEVLTQTEHQSGDAWQIEGRKILNATNSTKRRDIPSTMLASFIFQVGQRRCRELFQKNPEKPLQCHNHCYVNYKHFPFHSRDADKARNLWKALSNVTSHQVAPDSIHSAPFGMIVLERNDTDRWRSHWYAKETGDWNVQGAAYHKAKLAAAEIPTMDEKFRKEHKKWFEFVRSFIQTENANESVLPAVELSYDNVTNTNEDDLRLYIMEQLGV